MPAAAPASADAPPPPAVTFLDVASSIDVLSAGDAAGAGATALTPAGYGTGWFDVSDDGNTMLAAIVSSAVLPSIWDSTYGIALVRRAAGITTTTILTNSWDTNPVLSADGSTAWWMADGTVWKYSAGSYARLSSFGFAPATGQDVRRFAVSPDGTRCATMYHTTTSLPGGVVAADCATGPTGASPYVLRTFPAAGSISPDSNNLTWIDNDTVLYGVDDGTDSSSESATLNLSGGTVVPLAFDSTGLYQIQQVGGSWWAWRDVGSVTQYAVVAALTDLPTATWLNRIDGDHTICYVPSAVAPPAVTMPANRAQSFPHLVLSAATVPYGRRAAYASWAEYLTPVPGETLAADAGEVNRGVLQYSFDARVWRTLGWTSWAKPVAWPGSKTAKGNGVTQVLTRNTWFRWVYPGDYLTLASTSVARRVTVSPIVTVKVTKKKSQRLVSGRITRVGGPVLLQRLVKGHWVKVATVRLATSRAYSFGFRRLPHGTYRVLVQPDRNWASGYKRFAL